MALVKLKTIWTPLMLFGIRIFKDDYQKYYIKVFNRDIKKLG
ncbi:hypothetical protein [Halalkalibacter akibai]|nr:hypothetical protein [Halalkalibacter akibai]